jgi:hypothetical protein
MKNILRSSIIYVPLLFIFSFAEAQKGEVKMSLNYNYSLPLGGFKNDLVSNGSPRGFMGDVMFSLTDKFSLGLYTGFQDYYQKYPRTVYHNEGQDISAVLSNSIQTIPLLAKAMFNPMGDKKTFIQPYITLGAGANMIFFKQYLGEFGGSYNSVNFMAQAGAGLQIPFSKWSKSGFQIGANYNYVPYSNNGYSNLNSLDIQAGVHFPIR